MKKEKRFEIVYQEGGFMGAKTIYVDKETGVNYLFIHIDRFCAHETAFLIHDLEAFLFLHLA